MNFTYNSFPVHQIGDVTISQDREYEGGEAALRAKVTLRIKVDVFAESFADNFDLIRQFRDALKTQHAILQWTDTDTEVDYVNQTAEVLSCDLPEDPTGWGTWQQQVNVVFCFYETVASTNNLDPTFLKSGVSGPAKAFGRVRTWTQEYSSRRFSEQRSQRQYAGGRIEAAGLIPGDMSVSLAARRNALLDQAVAMEAECNGADGLLTRGSFSQVVRMENFRAQVNAAVTGIEWNFTATYSRFPDEAGYATCEFTAAQRTSVEDGDQFLIFSGRIFAPDEALARAKLAALRSTILATYGYGVAQQLRAESAAESVFANGDKTSGLEAHESSDGTTFIMLSFSEEYRQRNANVFNWGLRISTNDDVSTGLIQTSYSGFVISSGASADAAYSAALAQAQALGSGKESTIGGSAFQRRAQINWEKRQIDPAAAVEFVRLEFAYEYQSKMPTGRAYIELAEEVNTDAFGPDTLNVSGFVVADSFTAMQSFYLSQVKGNYLGQLIRNERTSQSSVKSQLGGGFTGQEVRLEFAFQILRLKTTQISYRYGISTTRDFLTMELSTRIHGSVFASDATVAQAAATALISGLGFTNPIRIEENVDREYSNAGGGDLFVKYDFDQAFVSRITGISSVLEMRLAEEVKYSGPRWVVQPTLTNDDGTGGHSIPQSLSVVEGSRTIRGTVTGADRATCETWARRHRLLLTGDSVGGHFPAPEELNAEYEFVPRVDGIAQDGIVAGGTGVQNVRLWRISFQFGEILPNYPPPA